MTGRARARSETALVGSPPDQKNASSAPLSSAAADSATPSCSRLMPCAGRCRATLEDALGDHLGAGLGRPDAHALALEVGERADPGALGATTLHVAAVDLGERRAAAPGWSNASRPSTASSAVSPSVRAMSALPSRRRMRFSTAPVLPDGDGAVALEVARDDLGVGGAVDAVDPALAAGRDRQRLARRLAVAAAGVVASAATAARDARRSGPPRRARGASRQTAVGVPSCA